MDEKNSTLRQNPITPADATEKVLSPALSTSIGKPMVVTRICCSNSSDDDDSGCVLDDSYTWIPDGVKPEILQNYFSALPADKIPCSGSPGERWRLSQLKQQLPLQDSDARKCNNLNEFEMKELEAFDRSRKINCMGQGTIRHVLALTSCNPEKLYCYQCKLAISSREIAITAPQHFQERAFWHPKCFICVECQELLVDLIYFVLNENVFCGRHHAEQLKPRCAKCDELIFSIECTEAEGRIWHMKHFACIKCNRQLGGKQYILGEYEKQPYCLPCYNHSTHIIRCNSCCKEIAINSPHIIQGTTHWHADSRCFCCIQCGRNLLGKAYSTTLNGELHCRLANCLRKKKDTSKSTKKSPCRSSTPISSRSSTDKGVNIEMSTISFDNQFLSVQEKLPSSSQNSENLQTFENIYETVVTSSPSTASSLNDDELMNKKQKHRTRLATSSPYYERARRRTARAIIPPPPILRTLKQADEIFYSSNSSLDDCVPQNKHYAAKTVIDTSQRSFHFSTPRCHSADGTKPRKHPKHSAQHRRSGRQATATTNLYTRTPYFVGDGYKRRYKHGYTARFSLSDESEDSSSTDDDALAFFFPEYFASTKERNARQQTQGKTTSTSLILPKQKPLLHKNQIRTDARKQIQSRNISSFPNQKHVNKQQQAHQNPTKLRIPPCGVDLLSTQAALKSPTKKSHSNCIIF